MLIHGEQFQGHFKKILLFVNKQEAKSGVTPKSGVGVNRNTMFADKIRKPKDEEGDFFTPNVVLV